MAESLSYTMEFKPELKGSITPDFLGLVDRIMAIIRYTDQLLSNSLGYEISFHSMLASIEASSFQFLVDMEIALPEQLILGNSMTSSEIRLWFSQSHETLVSYLSGSLALSTVLERWKAIIDQYHCRENFLFLPVDEDKLQALKQQYLDLLKQEKTGLIFSMKKIA